MMMNRLAADNSATGPAYRRATARKGAGSKGEISRKRWRILPPI